MIHPVLDRLTFVMEPDGVRLHWITDGVDRDWTGLKADNLVDEPASRRGPPQLPLKAGEWNAVTLRMIGDTVSLELNTTEVYRRELEPTNERLFGLFHYKDRTFAQIRNVVLTGDCPGPWPPSCLPVTNRHHQASLGTRSRNPGPALCGNRS